METRGWSRGRTSYSTREHLLDQVSLTWLSHPPPACLPRPRPCCFPPPQLPDTKGPPEFGPRHSHLLRLHYPTPLMTLPSLGVSNRMRMQTTATPPSPADCHPAASTEVSGGRPASACPNLVCSPESCKTCSASALSRSVDSKATLPGAQTRNSGVALDSDPSNLPPSFSHPTFNLSGNPLVLCEKCTQNPSPVIASLLSRPPIAATQV